MVALGTVQEAADTLLEPIGPNVFSSPHVFQHLFGFICESLRRAASVQKWRRKTFEPCVVPVVEVLDSPVEKKVRSAAPSSTCFRQNSVRWGPPAFPVARTNPNHLHISKALEFESETLGRWTIRLTRLAIFVGSDSCEVGTSQSLLAPIKAGFTTEADTHDGVDRQPESWGDDDIRGLPNLRL